MRAAVLERLRRTGEEEDGFTLIEAIITLAILSVVLGSLTILFTSGMKSQSDLTNRFQAQVQLNTGLLKLRRDAHSACNIAAGYTTSSITLNEPGTAAVQPPTTPCTAGQTSSITWCTINVSTSRYKLYRVAGTVCTATGAHLYADYLTTGAVFPSYTAENVTNATLAYLTVDFPVSIHPAATQPDRYEVKDTVVFRNSSL